MLVLAKNDPLKYCLYYSVGTTRRARGVAHYMQTQACMPNVPASERWLLFSFSSTEAGLGDDESDICWKGEVRVLSNTDHDRRT